MSGTSNHSKEPCPAQESSQSQLPLAERVSHVADTEDWAGPDDPGNPRNWPLWQRIMHSAIPAIYAFGLYAFRALYFEFCVAVSADVC